MRLWFFKTSFLYLVLFLLIFVFPNTQVRAVNSLDVAINEIAWMGTEAAYQDEWVELYNNTDSPIDLSGWRLTAADGTPEINLTGTVPANGFYLLERTDDTTIPDISADQIYTGDLKNAGENLSLYDNGGNLIDQVNFSGGWPAGNNVTKQTMERKSPQTSGGDANNWQTSQNPGGTPKSQNSTGESQPVCQPTAEICDGIDNDCDGNVDEENICQAPQSPSPSPNPAPTPTPQPSPETQNYPSGIFINEFLPSPEGPDSEKEFIELYNDNATSVNLSGWSIEDAQGSTKTYTFT